MAILEVMIEKISVHAQLFLTERCNAGCEGCPHSINTVDVNALQISYRQEMSVSEWQAAVSFLYEGGCNLFNMMGGEPTIVDGIEDIIRFTSKLSGAKHILSTNGIRMSTDEDLCERLVSFGLRTVAISFDAIPPDVDTDFWKANNLLGSREHKAWTGLNLIKVLRQEYPDIPFMFVGNFMLDKSSIKKAVDVQQFLDEQDIWTNICPRQTACIGEKNPAALANAFDKTDRGDLEKFSGELLEIMASKGGRIINSVQYIRQLPDAMGLQKFKCWEREPQIPWSIDVEPDGRLTCHWLEISGILQNPEWINIKDLINGEKRWEDVVEVWRENVKNCLGCSWSYQDRVAHVYSGQPCLQALSGRNHFAR